jgi:hypothetical protein
MIHCAECGSTDITVTATVWANDQKVIDDGGDYFCIDCNEEVDIEDRRLR